LHPGHWPVGGNPLTAYTGMGLYMRNLGVDRMASRSTPGGPRRLSLTPRVKVWLEARGSYAFGLGISDILRAVGRAGSIKQAAADLGLSYRYVWARVKEAEEALGLRLVATRVGGDPGARRSALTPEARRLVTAFRRLRHRMLQVVRAEFTRCFGQAASQV
jgi:molybdate transport system regulatory protein